MARRGGGRAAKASARQSKGVASFDKAWRQWVNPYPPVCQFSDDQIEAIADVGPGGHFFGAQHTLERFESAFYSPLLSDWSNFENWQDRGSLDATKRANLIYKDIIENFEPPKMEQAIVEELYVFVARREEEGGADISR